MYILLDQIRKPMFRVTRPYLNLLVKSRFFQFFWEKYNCMHFAYHFVPTCLINSTIISSPLRSRELSGRVLDSRPRGRGFEPHWRHFVVSLSKNINPSLVLVQPRKTRPFVTERLLMGRKESNQTKSFKILNAGVWR